ncbi:unnamed protein product [Dovyalis caffra]|uniref:Uncharacterized protein n=1 Tax=Dovyalis caffra TaxID=77055 RepID=A0AAV1SXL2_9ROSI|nr:unnamed protein product [Dovyalis caffra]
MKRCHFTRKYCKVLGHATSGCPLVPPKAGVVEKGTKVVVDEGTRSWANEDTRLGPIVAIASSVRVERFDPMHTELAGNSNGWEIVGRKGQGLNQPHIDRGATARAGSVHPETLRGVGGIGRPSHAVASHIGLSRLESMVENPDSTNVVVEEIVLPIALGAATRTSKGDGQPRAFTRVTNQSGGVKTRSGSRRVPTTATPIC